MDSLDAQAQESTILCLRKMIGPKFFSRFKFLGLRSRAEIFALLPKYRAAIVGSLFETFCLSAHELHQLGLPILMADIPTFKNFVHGKQVMKWQHNNTLTLKKVLHQAAVDDAIINAYLRTGRSPLNSLKAGVK